MKSNIVLYYNNLVKGFAALLCLLVLSTPPLVRAQQITPYRPHIVTSIKPLAIIAKSAVADRATVEYLQSPARSPHDWVLSISALEKLHRADLVIWIGPEFEVRAAKHLSLLPSEKRLTISDRLGNTAEAVSAGSARHQHLSTDAHLWLDPQIANRVAEIIQTRLALPVKEIISQQHIARINADLLAVRNEPYLSHHDGLGHFTRAFGLQPALAIRDSAGATRGAQTHYRLRKRAKTSGAHCVLVEPQYAHRDATVIATDLGLPLKTLDLQGMQQALHQNSYRQFMHGLAMQFKACFD